MVNLSHVLALSTPAIHTGVNIEQATVTVTGVVVCLVVVLTFAYSRFDKSRKETNDRIDRDRQDLSAMVTTVAAALGVRLDKVDQKLDKSIVDIAEIKGMTRASKARDERQDNGG